MVAEDYELDACTAGPSPRAPGLGCLSQAEEISTRIWVLCLVCLKITLPPSLSPPARQDQAPSQHSLLSHASCGAKEIILTYPLLRTLPGLPRALEITSKLPTSMESSSRQFRPTGQPRLPGLTPPSLSSRLTTPHLGTCYFLSGIPSSLASVHLSNTFPLFKMQPRASSGQLFQTPLASPMLCS